ncbi:MAG: glycosyltransferase family 4 protein [Holosporales bacterium]
MPDTSYKILQVLPKLSSGGVEQGTVDIARALVAGGHSAYVAAQSGRRLPQLLENGAFFLQMPLDRKTPWSLVGSRHALEAAIRQHQIQIVHARSRAPAWAAYYAARAANVPFITTFHGTYGFSNPIKRFYNSIMARGHYVIAISNFIQKHIISNYGQYVNENRIVLIHRGIDTKRFDPRQVDPMAVRSMRRSWGVPDEAKLILAPGRLTRWKGQAVLIDALRHMAPQTRVVFVGSDQGRSHYVQELREHAHALGVASRVVFAGQVDEMPEAYAASDVVVHAATEPEAFGRVVAEAGTMKRIVIASDLGGPSEIVVPNQTGFLTPAGDAEALAQQLHQVLQMPPEARQEMEKRAQQHILAHFSLHQMAAKTLDLYKRAIDEWRQKV